MLDDHHRQRKKGGGKRVAKRARKKVSKTTRGAVLGRMYGRAIIYWRVGTSEGSGVRAGRVVLHSRGAKCAYVCADAPSHRPLHTPRAPSRCKNATTFQPSRSIDPSGSLFLFFSPSCFSLNRYDKSGRDGVFLAWNTCFLVLICSGCLYLFVSRVVCLIVNLLHKRRVWFRGWYLWKYVKKEYQFF